MMLGLMFGQTKLETRVYEVEVNSNEIITFNLQELTGFYIQKGTYILYSLEKAILEEDAFIMLSDNESSLLEYLIEYNAPLCSGSQDCLGYVNNNDISVQSYNVNKIEIAITSEFPDIDSGYIEEGFEYCLNEGFNLVSYPCENSIPIAQAIPNGETFINSILGSGVASQYLDGAGWVGNLINLQSGDGYWFEANTTTCFQYECSE